MKTPSHGFRIVLTADRTLMAEYPSLFDGMMATIQTTRTPAFVMRRWLSPPLDRRENSLAARKAPLGLRRLEAVLKIYGFGSDAIIVRPEDLELAVGPATRVIGVSSGDPLGLGMSNTTMKAMSGGELYTAGWYAELLGRIRRLKEMHRDIRVVAGGPGTWQLENDRAAAQQLGIDTIFLGYAERDAAELFSRLLAGQAVDPIIRGQSGSGMEIPAILGSTSMGVVEISRGCGRGCRFCTICNEPMVHLPIGRIVADVSANVRHGQTSVSLISEDFLRYGADSVQVNPVAIHEMLAAVRSVPYLGMIQVDHVNVSSVMQLSVEELATFRRIMTKHVRHEHVWVNMGIETASSELLAMNGLAGKVAPFALEEWPRLCEQAVDRLNEAGYLPMVSLVLGLPGERTEHVEQTLELVERLQERRVTMFPIFYAPIRSGEKAFGLPDMTPLHWRLFRRCYSMNFKYIPPMFWDNQRAAGAPLSRRLFIQVAGRLQKLQWQLKFLRASRESRQ